MKKTSLAQITTILVTLITIFVNGLANTLPLNGQETGEISDRFDIYFVPAGYVFAIWGLIYLGLLAFTIYQALPAQKNNPLLKKIYPAYWIGNIANAIWIFLWHYEFFPLTLIAMIALFLCLLYIYLQIKNSNLELDRKQKIFIKLPISIYLGWVSVATIANISQVLYYVNWSGWGIDPARWAVIMLAIATILGLFMLWRETDLAYALVFVWAFIGIANSQADTALVANTAWVGSVILLLTLALVTIIRLLRRT